MITILDGFFWINFVYFFFSVFIAFFVPGDIILLRITKLRLLDRIILSSVLGLVIWGWIGMLAGYLNVRIILYPYLLICLLIWIKKYFLEFFIILKSRKINLNLTAVILILGVFLQVSIYWTSGLQFWDKMYFYGNPSDSYWHLSLTNQIVNNFPPEQPGYYGLKIENYHFWYNLIFADLIRIFRLPILNSLFQFSPLLISIFYGLSVIYFCNVFGIRKNYTNWLLFFLFFGGDFLYILFLLLGRGFIFPIGSLEDGSKFLINPPRSMSVIILFCGLAIFLNSIKINNIKIKLIGIFLLGSIIGFKVYIGFFALIGLFSLSIYYIYKRRPFNSLINILALIFSLIIYLPVNKNAGGLYFTGFWMFQNFIVQHELRLSRFELAREVFAKDGKWLKTLFFDLNFFVIFTFSFLGSKIIGIFNSLNSFKVFPAELHIFLIPGIIISMFLGSFFQQSSGGANTFNFLVNVYLFISIYSALFCFYFFEKIKYRRLKYLFIFLVIILTIPRVVHEWTLGMQNIYYNRGDFISKYDINTFEFIKNNTSEDAVFLVENEAFGVKGDSPFVSYFIQRPIFLSGEKILESHGIDIQSRKKSKEIILKNKNYLKVKNEVASNNIDYIVLNNKSSLASIKYFNELEEVYKNPRTKVYKVRE